MCITSHNREGFNIEQGKTLLLKLAFIMEELNV
jgi:hypothetical protein